MPIHERPLFTETFDSPGEFRPTRRSVYVCAHSVEPRSDHVQAWRDHAHEVSFIEVLSEERHAIVVRQADGAEERVALRSSNQVRQLWGKARRPTIYLDITGLRHHVWAVLLRGALETRERVVVIYVEPEDYRPSLTPTENQIYDLSERIEGIAPLPGFARTRDVGERSCFVPLLGFEGTRVSYLISQLEPPGGKTTLVHWADSGLQSDASGVAFRVSSRAFARTADSWSFFGGRSVR
jgi:hypothetical protein